MDNSSEDGQFNQLVTAIGSWCEGPFAQATELGQIRRLHEEVDELKDAICGAVTKPGGDCEAEMADILMIIFHMAYRRKSNLFKACIDKWEVNRQREWQADAQGDSVSHVRDAVVPND